MKLIDRLKEMQIRYSYDEANDSLIVHDKLVVSDLMEDGCIGSPEYILLELPSKIIFEQYTAFYHVVITNTPYYISARGNLSFTSVMFRENLIAKILNADKDLYVSWCMLTSLAEKTLVKGALVIERSGINTLQDVYVKEELTLVNVGVISLPEPLGLVDKMFINCVPVRKLPWTMQSSRLVLVNTSITELPEGYSPAELSTDKGMKNVAVIEHPLGGVVNVWKKEGKIKISYRLHHSSRMPTILTVPNFYKYIEDYINRYCGGGAYYTRIGNTFKQLKKEVRAAVKKIKNS